MSEVLQYITLREGETELHASIFVDGVILVERSKAVKGVRANMPIWITNDELASLVSHIAQAKEPANGPHPDDHA